MDFCCQVHTHKKAVPRSLKARPIARFSIIHGIMCSVLEAGASQMGLWELNFDSSSRGDPCVSLYGICVHQGWVVCLDKRLVTLSLSLSLSPHLVALSSIMETLTERKGAVKWKKKKKTLKNGQWNKRKLHAYKIHTTNSKVTNRSLQIIEVCLRPTWPKNQPLHWPL